MSILKRKESLMKVTKLEQRKDIPKLTLTIETLKRLIKELESGQ